MTRARTVRLFVLLVLLTGLCSVPTTASAQTSASSEDELDQWHTLIAPVLSLPGSVFTDADEQTLQLVVGIEDLSGSQAVLDLVAALGVPSSVVTIVEAAPFRPLLGDRVRPVVGGLQIQFQSGFLGLSTGTCTLGFGAAASRLGARGFVTAAHCSRTWGSLDNGRYWQPTRPFGDGDQVGTEIADPSFFTSAQNSDCPPGRRCRFSDANFVRTTSNANINVGTIANPPVNSTNWNGQNVYRVSGNTYGNHVGLTATKVGRTTGRTAGPVTFNCATTNVANSDLTMMCQNFAQATVDPGDSGSPVIQVTNSSTPNGSATLLGVLWGESTVNGQEVFAYSAIGVLEFEFGPLSAYFGA